MLRSREATLAAAALLGGLLLAGCAADPDGSTESTGPLDVEPVTPTPSATPYADPPQESVAPTPAPAAPPAPTDPAPAPTAVTPEPAPAAPEPTPAAPPPPPPSPSPPPPPPPPPPPQPQPEPQPPPQPLPPPTPTTPPAEQPWPREGSHVSYTARVAQSFGGGEQHWETYSNATWAFRNGDWHGECVATVHDDSDGDGIVTIREERATYAASAPPHWPLFNTRSPPAIGEPVTTWYLHECEVRSDEEWLYRGTSARDGAPTHLASSNPDEPPYDFDTEWSAKNGLVLSWSKHRFMTSAPYSTSGEIVSTDAPMT